ncbi:hypothetical protein P3T76_011632 [Phytophthora citrophthora]|uniref:Uncharacterized protein n=1 Tax=Phytophthora citrophthora TaxID=4793 RepID=A0AAD9G8N5_9STRA|nr:hypothetical protein P3T76_011632 [Phytophthora citrophthora]
MQVSETDFPEESTFQHQLMAGIAAVTEPTCSICPELSKTFPSSGQQSSRRIKGEVDFYLDGGLQWGIELLVNGKGITKHMDRFTPGGKCYELKASDYAVFDFRCNKSGKVTNVQRKDKRVSVFFRQGDYSSCKCIFGFNKEVVKIRLEN